MLYDIAERYYLAGKKEAADGNDYGYDDNGNLTNDGTYKYYYDCENRLTDVNEVNDAAVASYGYDYEGRRISKTVYGSPNVTTKYCYDGEQIIAEYNGSTLVKKFIYGPGIDEPICMIDVVDSNAVYYYHFDGTGSVIALSDVNSVIVERYSYDVFGEPNTTSSIGNPYLFTGRRYDIDTGLYYYRARYYKPGIGRFLQTDPIGYAGGLNLYAYCGNDPVNWIDPLGLHIMNILPMTRVPSIMWALGNQGEKGKEKSFREHVADLTEKAEETIDLSDPSNYSLMDVFNLASNMERQIFGSDARYFNNNFRHAYAAALIARKHRILGRTIVNAYINYYDEPLTTWDAITDRIAEQIGLEISREAEELGQTIAETLLEYYPNVPEIRDNYDFKKKP